MAKFEYWPRYGFENHTLVLPAERSFNLTDSTLWMQDNWLNSLAFCTLYVIAIFGGQKLMSSQKPFGLDQALFWWNLGLATFSAMGMVRMVPELIWSVNSNSFIYSICTASYAQGVTGFWTEKFALSKVFELVDTGFIVLRKRPLIFLHWYHHITVLVYTWMLYKDHTASGRWFITMNYTVHAFMYSYYALRALKIRLPKWFAMLITVMQITQMLVGVSLGMITLYLKVTGMEECQCTWTNLYASFILYGSYFLLFCNFFYQTYLRRGNRYAGKATSDRVKSHDAVSNGNGSISNGNGSVSNGNGSLKCTNDESAIGNGNGVHHQSPSPAVAEAVKC
uniref:Elongation of very long chain fatty acids protein n=1 Tax=Globodera rostochiensis TaxID=31243 RepID=A0A914GWT0_GLORO